MGVNVQTRLTPGAHAPLDTVCKHTTSHLVHTHASHLVHTRTSHSCTHGPHTSCTHTTSHRVQTHDFTPCAYTCLTPGAHADLTLVHTHTSHLCTYRPHASCTHTPHTSCTHRPHTWCTRRPHTWCTHTTSHCVQTHFTPCAHTDFITCAHADLTLMHTRTSHLLHTHTSTPRAHSCSIHKLPSQTSLSLIFQALSCQDLVHRLLSRSLCMFPAGLCLPLQKGWPGSPAQSLPLRRCSLSTLHQGHVQCDWGAATISV